MVAVKILAFCVFLGVVAAEPIKFTACPGDEYSTIAITFPSGGKCTVNAVRISPCPEAASQRPCKLKRGSSPRIEFDYTTEFDARNTSTQAYWVFNENDLLLQNIETDSCKFTPCPIVKDEQHTFSYSSSISKRLPINTYDLKWRMVAGTGKECCFLFKVKIVK